MLFRAVFDIENAIYRFRFPLYRTKLNGCVLIGGRNMVQVYICYFFLRPSKYAFRLKIFIRIPPFQNQKHTIAISQWATHRQVVKNACGFSSLFFHFFLRILWHYLFLALQSSCNLVVLSLAPCYYWVNLYL